jgi:hypothetical protein
MKNSDIPTMLDQPLKVVALVEFNKSQSLVFNRMPLYKYTIDGDLMWANDGPFYSCFKYEKPSKNWQAFAGRKFDLDMLDGSVTKCEGQWWDGGISCLSEKLGLALNSITIGTVEHLIDCYVFMGTSGNNEDIQKLISEYKGVIYPYWDYEKVIKFDKMRHDLIKKQLKLERANKALIAEVKVKSALLTELDKGATV